MRLRALTALIAAVATLVSGCAGPSDTDERRDEAASMADRYLRAVSGEEEDRGWSLLHPWSQNEWPDREAYVAAAEAVDWSGFDYDVLETLYCDDGVMCQVLVDVRGGFAGAPNFLRLPEKSGAVGLRFDAEEGIPGNARLSVWLADLFRGPGGIMLVDG